MDCDIFVIKFMQLWSNSGLSRAMQMYSIVLNKIFFIFYDREFSLILYYILFCTGQGHKKYSCFECYMWALPNSSTIASGHFNIYIIHQSSKFGNGTPSDCKKISTTINQKITKK